MGRRPKIKEEEIKLIDYFLKKVDKKIHLSCGCHFCKNRLKDSIKYNDSFEFECLKCGSKLNIYCNKCDDFLNHYHYD